MSQKVKESIEVEESKIIEEQNKQKEGIALEVTGATD